MSESNKHRDLIALMARTLQEQYPDFLMDIDLQTSPGDPVPRIIGKHRPDIYVCSKDESFCIIGEAKTTGLEHRHTYNQMTSFVDYLETRHNGIFVMGVPAKDANRAKTLLRFFHKQMSAVNTIFQVFDGYDHWTLDKMEGVRWHLS